MRKYTEETWQEEKPRKKQTHTVSTWKGRRRRLFCVSACRAFPKRRLAPAAKKFKLKSCQLKQPNEKSKEAKQIKVLFCCCPPPSSSLLLFSLLLFSSSSLLRFFSYSQRHSHCFVTPLIPLTQHLSQEDRLWNYGCERIGASLGGTRISGWTNNFDGYQYYDCGGNDVIAGFNSYHSNNRVSRCFACRGGAEVPMQDLQPETRNKYKHTCIHPHTHNAHALTNPLWHLDTKPFVGGSPLARVLQEHARRTTHQLPVEC